MDSPIATASCASTQRRTGSGDGEFGDVVEDVSCMMNISQWLISFIKIGY